MYIEILGIVASLFVLACFTFDNPKIIRLLDMVGAGLYIVYGFCIGSFSNIFLNGALVIIQIVKLVKLYKKDKEEQKNESINTEI